MTMTECQVLGCEALTKTVQRIRLQPAQALDFKAGQYLRVLMSDGDCRPFSIANAPGDDYLELHIGAEPGNSYAGEVLDKIQQQPSIAIDGPHGKAFWRSDKAKPTVLMAGGTGFSYTYSILLAMLQQPLKAPVFFYWGTKTLADMYAHDALQNLAKTHKQLTFVPVLEQPPTDWQGKTGWVHHAVLEDFVSLEPYQVYLAGRFEMAGAAREDFHQKGLLLENLYGDAYEFI